MRFTLAVLTLLVAACDTAFLTGPKRTIETGPGEGEGAAGGEGEGAASGEGEGASTGEGEGEGAPTTVCAGQFVVKASAPIAMTAERTQHTAVLLKDGRVLLAGGNDANTGISEKSAEIFDSSTNTFTATGSMKEGRINFAMVALDDGRAIAFGGFDNDSTDPTQGSLATTEIWDPSTNAWTAGPTMPEPRDSLSAVKIAGGNVLVFGGQTNSTDTPAEVLVFDGSAITTAGSISQHGTAQVASLLSDGRVLVAGGFFTQSLTTVDLLASDGSTTHGAALPNASRSACAADDDKGRTVVFGGYDGSELQSIASFDPSSNAWSPSSSSLSTGRAGCGAAKLSCVDLVCGSFASTGCDAFDFASARAVPVLADVGVNFSFTLTALDDTHALLAGGTFNDFDVSQKGVILSLEPAP
jgi:hypothetical protein